MVTNRIRKANGHECNSAKNDEIIFTGPDCKLRRTDGVLTDGVGWGVVGCGVEKDGERGWCRCLKMCWNHYWCVILDNATDNDKCAMNFSTLYWMLRSKIR